MPLGLTQGNLQEPRGKQGDNKCFVSDVICHHPCLTSIVWVVGGGWG